MRTVGLPLIFLVGVGAIPAWAQVDRTVLVTNSFAGQAEERNSGALGVSRRATPQAAAGNPFHVRPSWIPAHACPCAVELCSSVRTFGTCVVVVSAASARQASSRRRSWVARHPVLFGTLVGFGAGFAIGIMGGDDGVLDDYNAEFSGLVLGGIGVGIGATAGAVIGR